MSQSHTPGSGQMLIRVHTCAVCRTDLHVVDCELTDPKLSRTPGHEIAGHVVAKAPFSLNQENIVLAELAALAEEWGLFAYARATMNSRLNGSSVVPSARLG